MCVCVCVGVCPSSLHIQINHEPSSSWSVISTDGAARSAPRVLQGPPLSQSNLLCHNSCFPLLLVGLGAKLPCPSGGPPTCLSCAGTGSREEEKKGRKKEGRERGYTAPTSHQHSPESTELEDLKIFNPYSKNKFLYNRKITLL